MTTENAVGVPAISAELLAADDETIREALLQADVMLLRTVMVQLTGDERLRALATRVPETGGSDRVAPPTIADPGDQKLVRDVAFDVMKRYRDGTDAPPPPPALDEFRALLELTFSQEIADTELPFWWEELGVEPLPRAISLDTVDREKLEAFQVVVIGAGMNGIAAAVHLDAAGLPYTVIEKNGGVGGTWHENVYPGARVDVASRAYGYTFEPDFPWRDYYATQPELQAYFDYCVDKYGVRDQIQFHSEVESLHWDDEAKMWDLSIRTPDGTQTMRANAVISAVGLFNRPRFPDIDGIDSFAGKLLHTAAWDRSYELDGKRVAVIGTGSSGVQVVNPLSSRVGQLYVFQRSGTWLANVPNYRTAVPAAEQWLLDCVPYYLNWVRLQQVHAIGDTRTKMLDVDPEWEDPDTVSEANFALRSALIEHLVSELDNDPELVAACIPTYPPLAKRLPKDNGWYEAITRGHVELVSDPIERITPTGIRTASGREVELDAIVCATGFRTTQYLWPMRIEGRDGITLDQAWSRDGARAYMGMTIPGFPNLFCLYGPNTNGKSGSPCSWGEMQVRYATLAFKYLLENDLHSLEVKPEVYHRFNAYLDKRLSGLIWMDQRQRSYYLNEFNRIVTNGAWLNAEYSVWTREPALDEFILE
jgi:4-hydroxyacetophenone monooxygenase